MALSDAYSTPTIQGWQAVDKGLTTSNYIIEKGESGSLLIKVATDAKTVQVQHRHRSRYKPSYVSSAAGIAAGLNQQLSEVWTAWPVDAQGAPVYQGDSGTAYTTLTNRANGIGFVPGIARSYDFDSNAYNYDAHEYEYRVRVYDSGSQSWSEWGYAILRVGYMPHILSGSFVRDDSTGEVAVTLSTLWEHPYSISFAFPYIYNGTEFEKVASRLPIGATIQFQGFTDTQSLPSSFGVVGMQKFATMRQPSGVTVAASLLRNELPLFVLDTSATPSTLPTPSIDIDTSGDSFAFSVSSTGAAYDDVDVAITYTNQAGELVCVSVQAEESGGVWSAVIDSVPFDIPVTATTTVKSSAGFAHHSTVMILESNGRFALTYNGETEALRFNPETSTMFSIDGEAVKLAGRENPASRYGEGGVNTITVNGAAVQEDDWPRLLSKLKQSHDWTYREPGGFVARVMVSTISSNVVYGQFGKFVNVSLTLVEVA